MFQTGNADSSNVSKSSFSLLRSKNDELKQTLGPKNFVKYKEYMQIWFSKEEYRNRMDWEFEVPFLVDEAKILHNEIITLILELCCKSDFDVLWEAHKELQEKQQKQIDDYLNPQQLLMSPSSSSAVMSSSLSCLVPPQSCTFETNSPTDDVYPAFINFPASEEEDVQLSLTNDDGIVEDISPKDSTAREEDECMFKVLISDQDSNYCAISKNFNYPLEEEDDTLPSALPNVMSFLPFTKIPKEHQQLFSVYENEGLVTTTDMALSEKITALVLSKGLKVDNSTVKYIIKATKEYGLRILRGLSKQSKGFQLKDGILNLNEPPSNPYLLSKHHLKLKDKENRGSIVNSTVLDLMENDEQRRALQAAVSFHTFEPPRKISLADLFQLIKTHSELFGNPVFLLEKTLLNYYGFKRDEDREWDSSLKQYKAQLNSEEDNRLLEISYY